jgi:hypothetical protein
MSRTWPNKGCLQIGTKKTRISWLLFIGRLAGNSTSGDRVANKRRAFYTSSFAPELKKLAAQIGGRSASLP